jgi:peptide/nickel transport system substrate-binding protein
VSDSARLWPVLIGLLLLGGACAPAAQRPSDARGGAAAPRPPTNLNVVIDFEPQSLGARVGAAKDGELRYAVNQPLTNYDDEGGVIPRLALEVPSVEKGTWVLRPDGTMQVTYRLRPDVTWHDGTPFTSKDVAFSWMVNADAGVLTSSKSDVSQISRVDTPDDLTAVVEWKNIYPFAHVMVKEELGPYPRHLLEADYLANRERLQELPYWTHEYVGVGPYRLEAWEPGSHVILKAYDGYFLGRPKIDTIKASFIVNHDTIVANMLAGAIDGSPWILKSLEADAVIKAWENDGRKPVALYGADKLQTIVPQFRDPKIPETASNARVRQALMHAVDRQQLTDLFSLGKAPIANGYVHPSDRTKNEWIKDSVVTYDYNPRRAQELLDEVWPVGGDGARVSASGERIVIPILGSASNDDPKWLPALSDAWKTAGVGTELNLLRPESLDRQFAATYPGFNTVTVAFEGNSALTRLTAAECGTEASRWLGSNTGCYRSSALEPIIKELTQSIDPNRQRPLYQQWARTVSQELPLLPMYYTVNISLWREGITGVRPPTVPNTRQMWSVHEWEIVS